MKQKLVVGGLCVALVLGVVACSHQAEQAPQEPSQGVQQTDPVTAPPVEPTVTPVEVKQEIPQQTEPEPEENTDPAGDTEPVDTSDEADGDDEATPDNEVQLFIDCNETVYATGTVNIRESWTASSTKLGSLSRGQSVTRTGTSIQGTEAEGWSRVTLSDGTTAYISNQYLSTTKPAQQSTNNGGGTTTPGTQTGGSTTTQPSGTTSTTTQPSGTTSTDNKSSIAAARREAGNITENPDDVMSMSDPDWDKFVEGITNALNP